MARERNDGSENSELGRVNPQIRRFRYIDFADELLEQAIDIYQAQLSLGASKEQLERTESTISEIIRRIDDMKEEFTDGQTFN